MKITLVTILMFAMWAVASKLEVRLEGMNELGWTCLGASLFASMLASLVAMLARAGRIELAMNHLRVASPLGFSEIPYSRIEAIRRCRRGGSGGKSHHVQVEFQSLGERKVLRIRPRNAVEFAAQLRRKCPRLSSTAEVCLIKNLGQGKLLDSVLA